MTRGFRVWSWPCVCVGCLQFRWRLQTCLKCQHQIVGIKRQLMIAHHVWHCIGSKRGLT